jgi:hypothetical protein
MTFAPNHKRVDHCNAPYHKSVDQESSVRSETLQQKAKAAQRELKVYTKSKTRKAAKPKAPLRRTKGVTGITAKNARSMVSDHDNDEGDQKAKLGSAKLNPPRAG